MLSFPYLPMTWKWPCPIICTFLSVFWRKCFPTISALYFNSKAQKFWLTSRNLFFFVIVIENEAHFSGINVCSIFEAIFTCQFHLKQNNNPPTKDYEVDFWKKKASHDSSGWQTFSEFQKWIENSLSTWQRCFAVGIGRAVLDSWYRGTCQFLRNKSLLGYPHLDNKLLSCGMWNTRLANLDPWSSWEQYVNEEINRKYKETKLEAMQSSLI